MKPPQHTVARLAFETVLERRQRVVSLQDRISVFARRALQDVLAEGLSRFDRSQRRPVFLKVELDLGEISFDFLERDLEVGIARELRAWALRNAPWPHHDDSPARALLPDRSIPSTPDPEFEPESAHSSHRIAQAPHGQTGDHGAALVNGVESPGNLAGSTDHGFNLSLKPEERERWLTALRNNPTLRYRMAAELAPQRLPEILQSWIPEHSQAIAEFAIVLSRLRRDLDLVFAGGAIFERQLLICILDEAAGDSATRLSLRVLLHRIVARLARDLALPSSGLARQIAAAWKRRTDLALGSQPLFTILREFGALAEDEQGAATLSEPSSPIDLQETGAEHFALTPWAPSIGALSEPLVNLAKFLEWGVLPWSGPSASTDSAESEMLASLSSAPDQVCDLIRILGVKEHVRERIALQFSETSVQRLIGELDPVNANWMLACTRQLRMLHRQRPLIPLKNEAFGQLLSELTFEYLSERHWHALDAVSFLRFLLRRLAYRQRMSYEFLLADLALRRSPDSTHDHPSGEIDPQLQLSTTIVTLLDTDLLGIRSRLAHAPRFAVRPEFRHLYCDLDVLAYWLRWRILPAWSLDDRPAETVPSLKPLCEILPPDCVVDPEITGERSAVNRASPQSPLRTVQNLAPALQIERWLNFGLWPALIETPSDTAVEHWLQDQSDADWLCALERCGAQDGAIHRITRLSPPSVARIVKLLSGPHEESVHEFLLALQSIGRSLEGSFPPPWQRHVNRCALIFLLQDASAEDRSASFLRQMAHATLLALSLTLQIPYERQLFLLRRQCPVPSLLHNLCIELENDLEEAQDAVTFAAQPGAESAGADLLQAESAALAKIYLLGEESHSVPPALGFAALQSAACQLSDSELKTIAQACINFSEQRVEILSRAERLLPPDRFARLQQLASDGDTSPLEQRADNREGPREQPDSSSRRKQYIDAIPQAGMESSADPELQRAVRSWKESELSTATKPPSPALTANLPPSAVHSGKRADISTKLDAIVFFLASGVIPSWGDREISGPSSQWIEPLLEQAPEDLVRTLRSAARSPKTVERLLRYVPRNSLAQLISHAEPAMGGMIVLLLRDGDELDDDAEPTQAQRSRVSAVHWQSALELILDPDQPRRSSTETLRYLCNRIARQLGISTSRYLDSLATIAEHRADSESAQAALAKILLQLRQSGASSGIDFVPSRKRLSAASEKPASPLTEIGEQPAAVDAIRPGTSQPLHSRQLEHGTGVGENVLPLSREIDAQSRPQFSSSSSSFDSAPAPVGESRTPDQVTESNASGTDGLPPAPLLPSPPQTINLNRSSNQPVPLFDISHRLHDGHELSNACNPPRPSPDEAASHASAAAPYAHLGSTSSTHEPVADQTSAGAANHGIQPVAPIDPVEEEDLFVPNLNTQAGQLEHLLRFGALPDSCPAPTVEEFMSCFAEAIRRHPQRYRRLIARAARRPMERKRMVQHFSAEALCAVWELLMPVGDREAMLCMEELAAAACLASSASRRQEIRRICAEELLEISAVALGEQWEPSRYLRRALLRLPRNHALGTVEVAANLRAGFLRQPEPLRSSLIAVLDRVEREIARLPVKPSRSAPTSSALAQPARRPLKPSTPLPEAEPFYIANAGAILLWPFLGRYFETLRLMHKNAFLDDSARSRAIYLLQHLVSGKAEAPEPALLLNKILCGALPEQPVDAAPEITEEEAALSNQLLQGVIANWGKLGNTSIDGLRESFLLREGRLVCVESGNSWLLTVSVKGYDILLDSLPWRLSMIRLPWMQTLLNTKWR